MDDTAIARAIDLDLIIEKDLKTPRRSFVVAMANDARDLAIEATRALLRVDAEDFKAIRAAQNEVQRYVDFVAWVHARQADARDRLADLAAEDARSVRDILRLPPEMTDR